MFEGNYVEILDRPQFIRFLIHCLRHHPDKRMRYICAYHADATMGDRLLSALICRAADKSEHPTIRGQCLENLSFNNGRPGPKSRVHRKAFRTVLECLKDPQPYVRFRACYAVAHMRMHRAIPRLQALTVDEAPAAMGVTVGWEATEAIKELRERNGWEDWPESSLPPDPGYEDLRHNPYA